MRFRIEKSFERDIAKIRDRELLGKLRTFISTVQVAGTLREIPNIKKIEGYKTYYRMKIGDYRLGMEAISEDEVVLVRFLHRREVYRYFPKRR